MDTAVSMPQPDHVVAVTSARHEPDDALRWAVSFAQRWQVPMTLTDITSDHDADLRNDALRRLATSVHPDVGVATAITGSVSQVLELADHGGDALIVTPADGRRSNPNDPWGSLAHRLAAHGRHLVLRVRTGALSSPLRIMAPLDDDVAVARVAAEVARTFGSRLHLMIGSDRVGDLSSLMRDTSLTAGIEVRLDIMSKIDGATVRNAATRARADMLVLPAGASDPDLVWLMRTTDFTVLSVPATAATAVAA